MGKIWEEWFSPPRYPWWPFPIYKIKKEQEGSELILLTKVMSIRYLALVPKVSLTWACLTTAIWHCCKPLDQWHCSFHALPLANQLATASDRSSKTGSWVTDLLVLTFIQVIITHMNIWISSTNESLTSVTRTQGCHDCSPGYPRDVTKSNWDDVV